MLQWLAPGPFALLPSRPAGPAPTLNHRGAPWAPCLRVEIRELVDLRSL